MDVMRERARALFGVAVAAADPAAAVTSALVGRGIGAPRVRLVAVGKAARPMARAALEVLGGAVVEALVVTNAENAGPVAGASVMIAGHPVPDAGGAAAARAVEAMAGRAQAGDVVLALISGGGSAMLPAPVDGVSLEDKAEANRAMLGGGLDITRMNAVRQQLSRLKGGGLARAAAPARVVALILSDVIGDDLRVIASGPTVAPITDRSGARAILVEAGLWDAMPSSVRAALQGESEGDDQAAPLPEAENHLIGSNALSVRAMAAAAGDAAVEIWSEALEGDVEDAAAFVADKIRTASPGARIGLCGGETTVVLRGAGLGGRNQELALRVARRLEGLARPWVFLSGGTDGRDGPTEAAGAIVDGGTLARIAAAGGDVEALLADNDSHAALSMSGDLLLTGGTGTNVADVQVIVLG